MVRRRGRAPGLLRLLVVARRSMSGVEGQRRAGGVLLLRRLLLLHVVGAGVRRRRVVRSAAPASAPAPARGVGAGVLAVHGRGQRRRAVGVGVGVPEGRGGRRRGGVLRVVLRVVVAGRASGVHGGRGHRRPRRRRRGPLVSVGRGGGVGEMRAAQGGVAGGRAYLRVGIVVRLVRRRPRRARHVGYGHGHRPLPVLGALEA